MGHGNFLAWLDAEFEMKEQTARNFMNVAAVYGAKSPIVGDLKPTALYELAAPKTPLEVREEIEKMIEAGEVVTKATVQELRRFRAAGAISLRSIIARASPVSSAGSLPIWRKKLGF